MEKGRKDGSIKESDPINLALRWSVLRHPIKTLCSIDPQRLMAWATVGIATLTFCLAIIAVFTLSSSENSTRRSERAYLFVSPNNAYNVKAGGSPLQGYILIGNSGKTFGTIVDWQFGVNVSEPNNPNRIESLGKLIREPGNPVIWPGLPHVAYRTLRTISAEEYQAIRSEKGEKRVYVFGFVKYKDVFDDLHVTTFCHMYFGSEMANDSMSSYLRTQVKYCETHNDAT